MLDKFLEHRHVGKVDIVDAFVASGGISTSGLGARHVVIVVGTRLAFCLVKSPLYFVLGLHGFGDGLCGLL